MSEHVKPTQPTGVRDYGPGDVVARRGMFEKIRLSFEKFGFNPLETPAMERMEVLTGGAEKPPMIIFETTRIGGSKVEGDSSSGRSALRYDLTVALARYVAANLDKLTFPFMRYQVGPVWRGEKAQKGRFQEFVQFDADIVGSASPLADATIIAMMVETMRNLGIDRFVVRFNDRKILNGLPGLCGFPEELASGVLRIIDKLPKIGKEAVLRELAKPKAEVPGAEAPGDDSRELEHGLGLSSDSVTRLEQFLNLTGTNLELLDQAEALFKDVPIGAEGVKEIREIINALKEMSVPEENWQFDLSIARGLAYYTGPVFETFLTDAPQFGSVFSGGRYDDLVSRFLDSGIPATGASVGVDRLFAALEHLGKVETSKTVTQVLVTTMDPSLSNEYLRVTAELRANGISTVMWLVPGENFKAQLANAVKQEIPVVIIIGTDEAQKGTVTIKDMRKRQQKVVSRAIMTDAVLEILAA